MSLTIAQKVLIAIGASLILYDCAVRSSYSATAAWQRPAYSCTCKAVATAPVTHTSFFSTRSEICVSPLVENCMLQGSSKHADWTLYPLALNQSSILFTYACYPSEPEALKAAEAMCAEPTAPLWGLPSYLRGDLILAGSTVGWLRAESILYTLLSMCLPLCAGAVLAWAGRNIVERM